MTVCVEIVGVKVISAVAVTPSSKVTMNASGNGEGTVVRLRFTVCPVSGPTKRMAWETNTSHSGKIRFSDGASRTTGGTLLVSEELVSKHSVCPFKKSIPSFSPPGPS